MEESEDTLLMIEISITNGWQMDIVYHLERTHCHQCSGLTGSGYPESSHEEITDNLKWAMGYWVKGGHYSWKASMS